MKRAIGIKNLSDYGVESVMFLPIESRLPRLYGLMRDFDHYDSLKDDIRAGIDWNMKRKNGAKVTNFEVKKKGFFTEFIVTIE